MSSATVAAFSINSSTSFRLLSYRIFHPPIPNMDRSISTFGSISAPITKFFTIFHPSRRSGPILHPSRCSGYSFEFSNFSPPSESSDYIKKIPPRLNQFFGDLRHFLLDTTPTLLRCNDSFVHPSHGTHPTQ